MNPVTDPQLATALTENLPDLSVTAVTVELSRPGSTDSSHSVPLAKPGTPLGAPPASSPAPPPRNASTPNSLGSAGTPSVCSTPNPIVTCGSTVVLSGASNSVVTVSSNSAGDSNSNVDGTSTPPVGEECPGTPVRLGTVTPSVMDSEKSNSPGPQKSSGGNYPVRHLKKVSDFISKT